MMAPMPPHLVPKYNELFMQLGWIMFFSMTFPAAAMFTIFAGLIRMSVELRGMSDYNKKDSPAPILDIGIWMDLLEFVVSLGIIVCMYLIIFTSKKLEDFLPFADESSRYIIIFIVLHIIFVVKFLLQEVIADEPEWVAEDKQNSL